jgi:hypothetical protein
MTITREEIAKFLGFDDERLVEMSEFNISNHFNQQGIELGRKMQRESDVAICDSLKQMDYCVDVREAAKRIRNNTGDLT